MLLMCSVAIAFARRRRWFVGVAFTAGGEKEIKLLTHLESMLDVLFVRFLEHGRTHCDYLSLWIARLLR